MQSINLNTEIKLRKAEHFLGGKRRRYFASGFKKICCKLYNYQYSNESLTASLKLEWCKGWSVKTSGQMNQHIGSIESSSVALRLLELFLILKFNLTDEEIASSFIRKIDFKVNPGNHTCDREIDVKVNSIHTEWVCFDALIGRFNIVVDNFTFMVEIQFSNQFKSGAFPYERFSQAITSNHGNYYVRGYKTTSINIENLVLNLEDRSVAAVSQVKRLIHKRETGIGACDLRGLTFIDFLSIAGQLTQILLYKSDNITREESNNMWVRSLSAEFSAVDPMPVVQSKAHFTEFKMVKMKEQTWRLATAQFEIGGINGWAKVCHILNH